MIRYPNPGTVIEIALPNGRFAYGRVYRDASLAIYRATSDEPGQPPLGTRDYRFLVGADQDVFQASAVRIVGRDDFEGGEDGWPPAMRVRDPINGSYRIYERGEMRQSSVDDAAHLEPAAVWSLNHIIDRIMAVGQF